MISIIKTDIVKEEENGRTIIGELRGLSTDTKPTKINDYKIGNGSVFIEIDTGNVFLYNGATNQWIEV